MAQILGKLRRQKMRGAVCDDMLNRPDRQQKIVVEEQAKKKTKGDLRAVGISLIIGFSLSLLIIWVNKERVLNLSFVQLLGSFLVHYFLILLVYLAQIMIHEAGHCIAALLSGYKFVSFRILSFMLVKYEDGYKFKRLSVPGTAGQSLMAPPAWEEGKFPYRLYLAGGVLFNVISGISLVILGLYIGFDQYWGRFSLVASLVAFFCGLQNGIPMKIGGMSNDGYDLKQAAKGEDHRRVLRDVLDLNARLQRGELFREVPQNWLHYDDEKMLKNLDDKGFLSLLNSKLMFLMDAGEYEKAYFLVDAMISQKNLLAIIRNELLCEKLFLELMLKQRPSEIENLYNLNLKKYIQQMKRGVISKRRLLYAYHKLWTKDEFKAEQEKRAFIELAKTYPILGELKLEENLMEAVDNVAKEHENLPKDSRTNQVKENTEDQVNEEVNGEAEIELTNKS